MKNNNLAQQSEERELRVVKKDFTFVVGLNLMLLALMVALYFWNRSTGQLEHWFSQLIKF